MGQLEWNNKGNEVAFMINLKEKKGFLCDMDGVIYHGERILPGVKEFVEWLVNNDKKFLFLTNASSRSPTELQMRLARMGLDIDESHFYTSAQATAQFLNSQAPGCSAYVVGDPGLYNALYEVGITTNDVNPDYVVIGETVNYNFDTIKKAMRHVMNGAKLIGTNTDMTGPSEHGIVPACRALVSPIELTTGKKAYFVGKPNPLMMRTGLKLLGVHSAEACMVGDRMDTDVIAGIETGMDSILVLTGVTSRASMEQYPYRPKLILDGVGDIPKLGS
jgi:NagD protein